MIQIKGGIAPCMYCALSDASRISEFGPNSLSTQEDNNWRTGTKDGRKTEKKEERSEESVMTPLDHCPANQRQKPCTGIVADTELQAVNRRIEDDAMTMMMITTIIMTMDTTGEIQMFVVRPVSIANTVAEEEIRVKKTSTVKELEDQENQVILQHVIVFQTSTKVQI